MGFGEGLVLEGAEGDELRPQGLKKLQSLGVVEGEGLIPGVGHPGPGRAPRGEEGPGLGEGRGGGGEAEDPFQVHAEGPPQGLEGRGHFPGQDQAQVALRKLQGGVLGKPAEEGEAHGL